MIALKRSAVVVCTFLVELAVLVALVAVGRRPDLRIPLGHLGAWLRDGDAATVVVALLRWVALLGAGWLVVSTLMYVAAALTRVPAAVRAVGWTTLPAVRRAVDAACAVSVATTIVLAPTLAGAASAADPPAVSLVRDGRGEGGSLGRLPPDTGPTTPPATTPPATTTPLTTTPPTTTPVVVAPPPPSTRASVAPTVGAEEVVVVDGDSLWTLAASHLAHARGRTATDDEIAPYWVQVCDANRARLQSGDVNLVFPGERVVLPAVS